MSVLKGILLQASVVCSFVCIMAEILDWYNPYMNFSGHVWLAKLCIYVAVLALALLTKYGNSSQMKNRKKHLMMDAHA